MLNKTLKQDLVKEINDRFKANPTVMVIEYKGLSVKEMQRLRRQLKRAKAEFRVVKNSLLRIASKETGIERINDLFEGPTAVAICDDDPASVAKVFVDSMKAYPAVRLKGGIVDGKVIGSEEVTRLSRLPSKEVLLSQFVGMLTNPIANFIGVLTELQRSLLYVLNSLKEVKEREEEQKG
ncbi:MAG TPA: 50S ribosomal protein L10 [Thermodesulfobacteriota bacterium]